MNKQVKILTNKLNQLTKEVKELQNACGNRLELLARNDGQYQNLQGQIIEKQKRLIDMQEFLQMITKEDKPDEQPTRPRADKKSQADKETTKPGKDK